MMSPKPITNAIALARAAKPVSEFRIFRRGENTSSKGSYLFDDAAARSVMARYEEQGVELAIDLEHLSLDDEARRLRADAADARGYCKLEMRDGALWATSIRWNPDGLARLQDRRQAYFSPAFLADKQGRVTEVLSIGLVAQPALHGIEPIAA